MSVSPTSSLSPSWRRTLLVQIENPALLSALRQWTTKHDVALFQAEKYSPDLIAVGCFASIIDRKVVGQKTYFQYLALIKEASQSEELRDRSICIIVDDNKKLELPQLDLVCVIDAEQLNSIQWILTVLNSAVKINNGT